MGMTDKQFCGYLRLLISSLKDIQQEANAEKKAEKTQSLLQVLQTTLED